MCSVPIRRKASQPCLTLLCLLVVYLFPGGAAQPACAEEHLLKGRRPYELDWAGRLEDDHAPLVDFENMEGWTVDARRGAAGIQRSQEQMIWGESTCRMVYQGHASGASFVLRPPAPMAVQDAFTDVNLWVWNDYWKWEKDAGQPMAAMSLLLETSDGKAFELPFCRDLDWPGWYLLHIRLTAEQRKAFEQGGVFKGIKLHHALLEEAKTIYLDNLSFYREDPAPLDYEVLPRPGVDLAPGQDLGVHTGEERLPFPTREETLLPALVSTNYTTEVLREGRAYVFRYRGKDGVLEYRYDPRHGTLGDVSAQWMETDAGPVRPMAEGGVQLKIDDTVDGLVTERFGVYRPGRPVTRPPEEAELVGCRQSGDTVKATWKVGRGDQSTVVDYAFRIWQKSLVVDVHAPGGEVGSVSLGRVEGALKPRLVDVPFWVGRPKVLLMGTKEKPLFLTTFVDHYRTGASHLYFENKPRKDGYYCGGGTHYLPKTDGKRNDCHERLFVTLSPRFEEVLPTIPNPASRWRAEAARNLVCYFAVKDREADYRYWKKIARYGMNRVIMLDWETCWRDGAESFTFRTRAAPGKGGDENLKEYISKVQALGLRYALYNNYVDFAPVNGLWDEDLVVRMPSGGWQQAWFRCYTAKPARAVKLSREMTAVCQDKFKPLAAGPDVHTAVSPWSRVDYDERMPGAGLMLTPYYAYGQLLLEQQNTWNGPVYSECDNNYYYSGLVTGSGGIDRHYSFDDQPWLVDFYLRKMQPLSCNWSLGYGDRSEAACDRFFARTIAFGLPGGFLGGWRHPFDALMIRGYYMLQQVQASYAQAYIREIRYADGQGALLDVSTALATGACARSQLRLKYDNGLTIWVNGHSKDTWATPEANLPPFGYYAKNRDGSLLVSSALHNGARADYVHAPAYEYVDGRGRWVEGPRVASDGPLIVLKKQDGALELIPFGTENFALALDQAPESVVALDMEGGEIGPTKMERRGMWYHVRPVPGAVSYRLHGKLVAQRKNNRGLAR